MEDASKALLMAAGVLIGILILSLGVYLFTTFAAYSKITADEYDFQRVQQFNNQFLKYEDKTSNTIYDVVSIINSAKENNIQDNGIYIKVSFNNKEYEKKSQEDLEELIKASIITNETNLQKYTVKCEFSDNTGYINKVIITKK